MVQDLGEPPLERRRGDLIMTYIRSFLPWIALAVLTGTVDVRWAASVALALAAWLIVVQRRTGHGWDALVIECSAVAFLAAYTAAAFAAPDSDFLAHYGGALSALWLAVTAWGSHALGRPFTLGIARTHAPEQVWRSALFLRINRVISAVWAAAFTVCGVGTVLLRHYRPDAGTARTLLTIGAFVLPMMFTARFPDAARARWAARDGALRAEAAE
jgi:hypothetical protein